VTTVPDAPLDGLKVLEIAGLYGEYAGKLLADCGAQVVLVEPPEGANRRRLGPYLNDGPAAERSLSFAYFHTSKRAITLDLDAADDRRVFAELAADADVILDGSGVPGAMDRRGLGYHALSADHQDLVYTMVTPFGSDGPYAELAATDIVLMAMGGLLSLGGYADGEPVRAHGDQAYLAAGLFAAVGTLLAVRSASETGVGQFVDVSAQDCVVMAHENAVQFYDLEKVVKHRNGGDQRQAGVGLYPCQDGYVYLLATGLGLFWGQLVSWLQAERIEGADDLLDPRWQSNEFAASAEGKAEFLVIFSRLAMHRTKAELYEAAKQARLPLCPVNDPADLVGSPQLAARGFFAEVPHVATGRILRMPGPAYQLSQSPARPRRAPQLGEHNSEIADPVRATIRSAVGRPQRAGQPSRVGHRQAGHLPLNGVRVIDFSWMGAGPYTSRVLADHGAEVIKIESTKRLDRLRVLPPFPGGQRGDSVNRSGYFADRNSNKLSATFNLKHPAAVELILRLIAQSDIVTSNFTPGTLTGLGLGYDAGRAARPDIIFLEMGMQGAYGPDSSLVGYGQTVSALTGLYHLSGLPGRMPTGTGTNYPDHIAAPAHAAFALLAALHYRARTGKGQYIDLSQAESMVALLGPAILDYTANGHTAGPRGNLAEYAAPHGVYRCLGDDRWLAISAETDAQWLALLTELDAAELGRDPRFATLAARHANHAELDAELLRLTFSRDAYQLMNRLQRAGVAAGVVQTYQDLVDADPQLRHRGHFATLDHPEMGLSVYNAPPFTLSGMRELTMRTPAPLLGQHTRRVCRTLLGLDDAGIDELVRAGVLV
jgi:crotonobetainyl-CoA:carnitine CoA-transferase CaiB-like acyl-CoA transferase